MLNLTLCFPTNIVYKFIKLKERMTFMKTNKIFSGMLGFILACSMIPNAMADKLTPEDLMKSGEIIVSTNTVLEKVADTSGEHALSFESEANHKYWLDDYYGTPCIKYAMPGVKTYTNPLDAKISFDITSANGIAKGDICLVKISVAAFYPEDHIQPLQIQIRSGENISKSTKINVNTNIHPDGVHWPTVYIPVKAEEAYATGDKFDIGLGGTYQNGAIGNVELINLDTSFSMAEVREAIGMEVTAEEITSVGTVIVSNDDLLSQLKNDEGTYVDKKFNDNEEDKNHYLYENAFNKCEGVKVALDAYAEYTNPSDAKISIPISKPVSQGDIILVSFYGQKYYSQNNKNLRVSFGMSDTTNAMLDTDVATCGETFGWKTTWTFDRTFYAAFTADKDYAADSNFDIILGYNDWSNGFIGNLTVKDIGCDYNLSDVKYLTGITADGINSIIYTDNANVDFYVRDASEDISDYIVALYKDGKMVDVKIKKDVKAENAVKPFSSLNGGRVEFSSPSDYNLIKVFAVDDVNSMMPVYKNAQRIK